MLISLQLQKTSPYTNFPAVEKQTINLEAMEQTDNQGKQRIWNTTSCGQKSEWKRNFESISDFQAYSFEVTVDDNGKTYEAGLYQVNATTSGTMASSETWISSVALSNDVIVPAGVTLNITSCSNINLNGKSIRSTGGTINLDPSATVTGLRAKTTYSNVLKGLYPTIQSAIELAQSGYEII